MVEEINNELVEIKNELSKVYQEVKRLREVQEDRGNLRPRFVESSPQIRSYRSRINKFLDMRDPPEGDIFIMGWVDHYFLDRLLSLARQIKIIGKPRLLKSEKILDAHNRLKDAGAEIRTNLLLHSRIFCAPKRRFLIIGSGDFQADCMGGKRFDAGVMSNHPELIKSAVDFFNRVWEESDPLPEKT